MQPNQNQPDYSFLNNSSAPAGPSKKQRIMVVVGGGLILLLAIIVGASLLFGGGEDTSARSLRIAQMHSELIRISEIGQKTSRGQEAKNLATTTHLTLLSEKAAIESIAAKDQKLTNKLLSAGQDTETDATLTEAEQRSQFDTVFIPLLVEEIKEYQAELEKAFKSTSSEQNKEVYNSLHTSLNKIIQATEIN